MGYFLTCFGTSKSKLFKRRRRNLVAATVTPSKEQQQQEEAKQEFEVSELLTQLNIEKPINPIVREIEKPLSCTTREKKLLDLNVKTNEEVSTTAEFTCTDKVSVGKNESDDQVKESVSTTLPSNCVNMEESNSDDRGFCDNFLVLEDTSESLFSLSIDSRKRGCKAEYGEKEVTSPLPKSVLQEQGSNENDSDPSQNLRAVSDYAVGNPSQQEAITPLKDQDKENVSAEQDHTVCNSSQEPSFKAFKRRPRLNSHSENVEKLEDQEISVDTSLSSWLVKSEATTYSPSSVGNSVRLILGELNVGEIKPDNRNSDKRPVTGSVGSYWSRTLQVVDSD